MKMQKVTVGPIVGYTTAEQVRIWIRGNFEKTSEGYRRCFGAARIKGPNDPDFGAPKFIKLPPYFDMTGVIAFTGLTPETVYEYQVGWFFAETELENLDGSLLVDWNNVAADEGRDTPLQFRTGVLSGQAPRRYVVGSCRYLLRLFGGLLFDERGDKTFNSILKQIASGIRIDGLVMMGDQIYADDLNLLSPDTAIDEFLSRYRNVFSQPGLRQLMSRVPTYMVLDDHEIEDNWPSKATDKDWLTLYPAAIHAYQIYQCSHSPLFTLGPTGRIEGTIDKFWYTFQDGCCDWFIMDSRSERKWDENPKHRRMIKPTQMEALLGWLNDGSGQVKMVVTSVPFFPDLEEENDDKWGGFISERTEILDHILENKIRKVVFLSGDVHCSFSIELTSPKDPGFKVISVISSSFFWPYPHMEEGDFQMKGKLAAPKNGNVYRVGSASDVFNTDNFARVEVTPAQIVVSFFERKGKQLGTPVVRTF
jgi:alkaline phosphatase D